MARGGVGDDTARLTKPEFASWLCRQVALRNPAAVVRFGDGEVRLLEADPGDPSSMEEANIHLRRETGRAFPSDAILEIKAAVEHARDEADVLGILTTSLPTGANVAWNKRLSGLCSERVAAGKALAGLASCHLNHEILAELPELVAGRRVSVISCRDVKPVIEARWGLEDVAVYQMPSQHLLRAVDGAYEASMRSEAVWPDAHDRIGTELTVREPGEVFMVGAGVFGKDLCVRVRDLGGIALDMGSTLDHIAGKLTRTMMRRVFVLHARGASIPDIAADLQDCFDTPIDHDRIRDLVDTVSPYLR